METNGKDACGKYLDASCLEGRRSFLCSTISILTDLYAQSLMLAGHLRDEHKKVREAAIYVLQSACSVGIRYGNRSGQPTVRRVCMDSAEECKALGLPWRLVPGQVWESHAGNRLMSLRRLARELRGIHPDVILPYVSNGVPGLWFGVAIHRARLRAFGIKA